VEIPVWIQNFSKFVARPVWSCRRLCSLCSCMQLRRSGWGGWRNGWLYVCYEFM